MQLKLNNGQFISFDQDKMNLCYSHIQDSPCWNIYTSNSKFLKEGFVRDYNTYVLRLEYGKKYDYPAYRVGTYCNYKDGKYDLSNIADNTVILFPDLETKRKIGFHIYNDNSVDVSYDKFVIEVTDVWEERTPIKGFKFEEEPIVYLKKNGVWLVEH